MVLIKMERSLNVEMIKTETERDLDCTVLMW